MTVVAAVATAAIDANLAIALTVVYTIGLATQVKVSGVSRLNFAENLDVWMLSKRKIQEEVIVSDDQISGIINDIVTEFSQSFPKSAEHIDEDQLSNTLKLNVEKNSKLLNPIIIDDNFQI